jgi:hypothetical protein
MCFSNSDENAEFEYLFNCDHAVSASLGYLFFRFHIYLKLHVCKYYVNYSFEKANTQKKKYLDRK